MKGHYVKKRSLKVEWNPQDCWFGVFWKRPAGLGTFDVWVCLVPMLPVHYRCQRSWVCSTDEPAYVYDLPKTPLRGW